MEIGFMIGFALVVGFISWEVGNQWWEYFWASGRYDNWRKYYDAATHKRADALRRMVALRSTGVTLHIDVYPRPEADAPVVIFSHGAMGYCRLFVTLALAFWDRGYTVVLPDQKGNGLSGGRRGDYTMSEAAQNIHDVTCWARGEFGDVPMFVTGASLGGSLAYYAAAAGAPATALAVLNLFDFSRIETGVALANQPVLVPLAARLLPLLPLIGWLRLPLAAMANFEDPRDPHDRHFLARWNHDPLPIRLVSVRFLASIVTTPACVSFEENTLPILVLVQGADQMIDPDETVASYERLGGPKKLIRLDGFNHISMNPAFYQRIVDACDAWFQPFLEGEPYAEVRSAGDD